MASERTVQIAPRNSELLQKHRWWNTLTYTSTKQIRVYNPNLAVAYYLFLAGLLSYVFIYTVGIKKGYQVFDPVTASMFTKVKGTTSLPNNGAIFDDKDLVQPPLMGGGTFLVTSFYQTANQTRGYCDGNNNAPDPIFGELCNCTSFPDDVTQCCADGVYTYNGMKTGVCGSGGKFCNLKAWCPLEPKKLTLSVLDIRNWTIFLRVDATFPNFGVDVSNVDAQATPILGQNLFAIEDILNRTGYTYDHVAQTGCVIVAYFTYDCYLDGKTLCQPTLSFKRIDPSAATSSSTGFNYRAINQYYNAGTLYRDQYKYYGIRFIISVTGSAGKFDLIVLSTTLGAGIAISGLATIFCDFIMTTVLRKSKEYDAEKFQTVRLKRSSKRIRRKELEKFQQAERGAESPPPLMSANSPEEIQLASPSLMDRSIAGDRSRRETVDGEEISIGPEDIEDMGDRTSISLSELPPLPTPSTTTTTPTAAVMPTISEVGVEETETDTEPRSP